MLRQVSVPSNGIFSFAIALSRYLLEGVIERAPRALRSLQYQPKDEMGITNPAELSSRLLMEYCHSKVHQQHHTDQRTDWPSSVEWSEQCNGLFSTDKPLSDWSPYFDDMLSNIHFDDEAIEFLEIYFIVTVTYRTFRPKSQGFPNGSISPLQ